MLTQRLRSIISKTAGQFSGEQIVRYFEPVIRSQLCGRARD